MSKLIDIVDSPQDLKKLPVDKLPDLAREIRDMLLDTISKTGGHLSSNLGVVELTMAMPVSYTHLTLPTNSLV